MLSEVDFMDLRAAAWEASPDTWLYWEWDLADSDAPRIAMLFAD